MVLAAGLIVDRSFGFVIISLAELTYPCLLGFLNADANST
jgi:hypothetical protein